MWPKVGRSGQHRPAQRSLRRRCGLGRRVGRSPACVAAPGGRGPTGQPEPVFVFPQHRVIGGAGGRSGGHVRVKLRGGDGLIVGGIAFEPQGSRSGLPSPMPSAAVSMWPGPCPSIDGGGGEKVEVRIMDAAKPE